MAVKKKNILIIKLTVMTPVNRNECYLQKIVLLLLLLLLYWSGKFNYNSDYSVYSQEKKDNLLTDYI